MATTSLSESFVSEQDIANFRKIFEPQDFDDVQEEPAIIDKVDDDNSVERYTIFRKYKSVLIIIILVAVATCILAIWPVAKKQLFSQDSCKSGHRSEMRRKGRYKEVRELLMFPDKNQNIKVYALRTTQFPPAVIIGAEYFFSDKL